MGLTRDECAKWNAQRISEALALISQAVANGAPDQSAVLPIPSTSAITYVGVNADQIRAKCSNSTDVSDVGCTVGNMMYLNADRDARNIAPIIEHELQHWYGFLNGDPSQVKNLLGPFGEQCAIRREILTRPIFGTTDDSYLRPTSANPVIKCGFGI